MKATDTMTSNVSVWQLGEARWEKVSIRERPLCRNVPYGRAELCSRGSMAPGMKDSVFNGQLSTAGLHADRNDPAQRGKPMGTKNKVH